MSGERPQTSAGLRRAYAEGRRDKATTNAKISATKMGHETTLEAREKMRSAKLGKPLARAHREAVSASLKRAFREGRTITSEERRARILGNRFVKDAPVIGECVYCFGPARTRDHVIPRGRPGWDDPSNIVPACFSCNDSKGPRTPQEWWEAQTETPWEAAA